MNQRLPGDVDIPAAERKAIFRDISMFFDEQFEQEVSEFRAEMILDFFLEKLSPIVYNSAIDDARSFLSERLEDMEATLFAKARRETTKSDRA